MLLTKFGHACVRLEADGRVLVIDPGAFSEASALNGADAVLITHEHFDHFAAEPLIAAAEANPGLQVWTVSAVADQLAGTGVTVHRIGDQDAFQAAGFQVGVIGREHAVIHPEIPRVANSGFLIDGELFHPGDAFTVPDVPVATLLLPVHAPWSKLGEVIDYVRAVAPTRALAVHDGLLNDIGLGGAGRLLGDGGPGIGTEYLRLSLGEQLSL